MLFYVFFNIGISGQLTQYSKTFPKFSRGAELQPLLASRTLSFPQMRCFGGRVKAGQGGGWGCGPEQLAATCALFTVVVSQWLVETQSFKPFSLTQNGIRITKHLKKLVLSGYSRTSLNGNLKYCVWIRYFSWFVYVCG